MQQAEQEQEHTKCAEYEGSFTSTEHHDSSYDGLITVEVNVCHLKIFISKPDIHVQSYDIHDKISD